MVSYGISINLVEVTWKGRLKQQFPNPNDYSSFMGDFSSATGVTLVCMTSCWNSVHVSLLRVSVRLCSPLLILSAEAYTMVLCNSVDTWSRA